MAPSRVIAAALLAPFTAVFLRAGWLEFRRWRRYGPATDNNRAAFPIDPDAPNAVYDAKDLDARTPTHAHPNHFEEDEE